MTPNRAAERSLALAASSSRLRGVDEVSRERNKRIEAAAISSMAALKEASLVLEGLWKPEILRTN